MTGDGVGPQGLPHGERFDDDYQVRACDVAALLDGSDVERRACAAELGASLREIGFVILTGHGVDGNLYRRAASEAERVFTEHTEIEKQRFVAQRHGSIEQGYFAGADDHDDDDPVESWVFCRRAFNLDGSVDVDRYWPARKSELVFREVVRAQERLVLPIMQAILTDLGQDPHLYDERLTDTNFALRLNYYPPIDDERIAVAQERLHSHHDAALFTLLPAPLGEGLQVLRRSSQSWVRVAAPVDSIILNTGDYMQRISNDVLPSATHRVSWPRIPELLRQPRVTFPMSVYLWEDEMVEVLPGLGPCRYEPVRAIELHEDGSAE